MTVGTPSSSRGTWRALLVATIACLVTALRPPPPASAGTNTDGQWDVVPGSVPDMNQARWYPTATTLADGRILATSGSITDPGQQADIPEVYNPSTNTWTQLTGAQLVLPNYPFMFVLYNGRVFHAGASEGS